MPTLARGERMADVIVRRLGEPITPYDPTGVAQAPVLGVFEPQASEPPAPWSEVGLAVRISEQAVPSLTLLASHAAGLTLAWTLSVRGARYRIVHIAPERGGLTELELALLSTDPDQPSETERWR